MEKLGLETKRRVIKRPSAGLCVDEQVDQPQEQHGNIDQEASSHNGQNQVMSFAVLPPMALSEQALGLLDALF